MADVVVVGAGVSGLSCAARLLERGHDVRIVAKQFTPNTTSDISAAMWWPFHAEPADKVLAWCMASYDEFVRLAADAATGVVMRNGVFGFGPAVPEWATRIPEAVPTPTDELFDGCAAGVTATAPMVEMNRYMPWLMDLVTERGGAFEGRSVVSIADVADCDLVINTAGLGARELVGDDAVYAARGRAVRLEQVGVERFFGSEVGEWPMHIFPRQNDIVVGGTYEENVEDLSGTSEVDDRIVERVIEVVPELRNAKRLAAVTGLRPARHEVRLEADVIDGVRVIHNYGHGGGGVTLSWGCADEVADIAAQLAV